MQFDMLTDTTSHNIYVSRNEQTQFKHPIQQDKNTDGIIDTSKLLFKPLTLPRQPSKLTMPHAFNHTLVVERESHSREQLISEIPTGPMVVIAPPFFTAPTPSAALHTYNAFSPSLQAQGMRTITRPVVEQSKRRSGNLAELLMFVIFAALVVALYLVVPFILALIPIFSTQGSRIVMVLELLAVGEFLIFRILVKTTRRSTR
jgi:hypothetical protein